MGKGQGIVWEAFIFSRKVRLERLVGLVLVYFRQGTELLALATNRPTNPQTRKLKTAARKTEFHFHVELHLREASIRRQSEASVRPVALQSSIFDHRT